MEAGYANLSWLRLRPPVVVPEHEPWVGEALINGDGYTIFGQQTVHWPPGYPFALAGFYATYGASSVSATARGATRPAAA